MSYHIVKHVKPTNLHLCELPGWWKRWRLRLGVGSVIECAECHRFWVLKGDLDMGKFWVRKSYDG